MKNKNKAYIAVENYMKNYNSLRYSLTIDIDNTDTEPEVISQLGEIKKKTKLLLSTIDKVIEDLKKDYLFKNKENIFKVFEQYYIFEKSYGEISYNFYISEKTARKYVNEVLQLIAIRIFGVEAL